jgi:hypothetical protein
MGRGAAHSRGAPRSERVTDRHCGLGDDQWNPECRVTQARANGDNVSGLPCVLPLSAFQDLAEMTGSGSCSVTYSAAD